MTLLFTDLVGVEQTLERLGDEGFEQVRRTHFHLLREVVARHGGAEVKNLGEGLMIAMASASAAVRCAVEIQRGVHRQNAAGGERMQVRVGLHVGEPIQDEADYFGTPVVVAKRLCDLAQPGEILASGLVRDLVGARRDVQFDEVGPVALKGLATPTEAVRVLWQTDATSASGDAAVPLPESLARRHRSPFVGRAEQSRVLTQGWKAAANGERHIAFVSGEPGIGKTRLATELATTAHADDAWVTFGRADDDLGVPYKPWAEALAHLINHAPADVLAGVVATNGAELARLVPDLERRFDNLPGRRSNDPETVRYLLCEAVVALLQALAQARPVLVVLDDMHWADAASIGLLRHVCRRITSARLMIVATYRESDLGAGHPLIDCLAALRREEGVDRVQLSGLDDLELTALLEGLAGHSLGREGSEFAAVVRRETAGNPFYTQEVLLHLTETGALAQNSGGRWVVKGSSVTFDLPVSVREVVANRVWRLGDEAAQTLSVAAVIGAEFDVPLLAAVVDAPQDEVLDVLEAAEAAALVAEVPGAVDRFTFVHALVQQTLYMDLSAARRRRIHRRVGEALEVLGGQGDRVGELARHWGAALEPIEAEKAVSYAIQAGERALEALAPHEAVRWFTQAGEQIDLLSPDSVLRTRMLVGLGDAQRQVGDPAYRSTLLDAGARAVAAGDRELLVRSALASYRGFVGSVGHIDDERVQLLEAALAAVGSDDSADRARLLATLSAELAFGAPYERRRSLADEGVAVARRTGDNFALLDALTRPYVALAVPEALSDRLARSAEAIALATSVADPVAGFWALHYGAMDSLEEGDIATTDDRLDQSRVLADRVAQPFVVWAATRFHSLRVLLGGDAAEAETVATEAFQIAVDAGEPDAAVLFGGQLAAVRRHQGRLSELVDALRTVAADSPGIPTFGAAAVRAVLEADPNAARADLRNAAAAGFVQPYDVTWLAGMTLWAEIAADLGEEGPAAALYDVLAPWRGHVAGVTTILCGGAVDHFLGRLATVLGRTDAGIADLHQALVMHECLRAPYWTAATEVALATALRDSDREAARRFATQAHERAQAHDCGRIAADAEQLLSALT
ncbi:MAG: AAA family ATPase [Acidimicrobiia bacterium]|nr:AAA family ATPase [Acidimicrobiia bacterium]